MHRLAGRTGLVSLTCGLLLWCSAPTQAICEPTPGTSNGALSRGGAFLNRIFDAAQGGGPVRADVQQAYDDAKTTSGSRHVDELLIRDAKCDLVKSSRFSCQIDFVRAAEPGGRLYFTVVTVDSLPRRWTLVSGLCRSP